MLYILYIFLNPHQIWHAVCLVYCPCKGYAAAGQDFFSCSLRADLACHAPHAPPPTAPPPSFPLACSPGSLALALRLKAINFAGLLLPWHIFACLSFKTIFIIVAAASAKLKRGAEGGGGGAWRGVLQALGLGPGLRAWAWASFAYTPSRN